MPDFVIIFVLIVVGYVGYGVVNVAWQASNLSRHKASLVNCYSEASEDDIVLRRDFDKKVSFAQSLGFKNCGLWKDISRPSVLCFSNLWLDSGSTTLLEIAVATFPEGTTYSHLSCKSLFDDNTVVVTNNLSGYPDLSGVMQMETHPRDITMKQLVQRHHERVQETAKALFVFTPESLLENYQLLEQTRVGGLVRNGYARYCDAERTQWRYTLWGSIRVRMAVTFKRRESTK